MEKCAHDDRSRRLKNTDTLEKIKNFDYKALLFTNLRLIRNYAIQEIKKERSSEKRISNTELLITFYINLIKF